MTPAVRAIKLLFSGRQLLQHACALADGQADAGWRLTAFAKIACGPASNRFKIAVLMIGCSNGLVGAITRCCTDNDQSKGSKFIREGHASRGVDVTHSLAKNDRLGS